jgi:spore coat protein U-like protein
MKKVIMLAAAAVMVVAMAGGASAAFLNPNDISVNAAVVGKCSIVSQDAALDFGNLDPETGGAAEPATLTGSLTVKCTKGHPFTVDAVSSNAGGAAADCTAGITGVLSDGAAGTMDYTFTCAAGSGNGFGAGAAVSLNPSATIDMTTNANKDAPVGAYTDTLTLTITY